ncbi:LOW QUALITY PROTEIN: uncharacterized protein LOC127142337 [Lates calcarifer]|uniref:LOW QUALITY PROTEIN: uncharacterized protein LOC127142337 n=1 Tax=Lates calcarifer TaxID=8187 RepID=A0AAJ8B4R5_LATCA|nr:LOW QUALITY PROTEIN: uncharacterized protein LOC127142337 [Lates calcarifer]
MVIDHLSDLGFNVNWAKSRVEPVQCTEYLGLNINSLSYRVTLLEGRLASLKHCLSLFQLVKFVTFRLACLHLLGLMASVISVVHLGLLRMRDFQCWVAALCLCPVSSPQQQGENHPNVCGSSPPMERLSGPHVGSPAGKGIIQGNYDDRCVPIGMGGATMLGRGVNGTWSPGLARAHLNILELWAVFFALKHFLHFLQGRHVLVKTDNSVVVAYINRQGGTHSLQLHKSARVSHVPGVLNRGWISYHEEIHCTRERVPVGQHSLVCHFMKGARRKLPVSRPLIPLWDLSVVLDALSHHPFEPMEAVGMKFVSLKTVLLLALTTAKRVNDLQAFSIRPSCSQFAPGGTKVCLRPNPAFVPKVVESAYRCPTVELLAFHPPFSSGEEQRLNTCPVQAVQVYVSRTVGFRKAHQLFVSWATPYKCKPLSRQRLSHWIVEAISLAYKCRGLQPPKGLSTHSTRGMATSWALFRGVSLQDICAAVSWATPHTFVRFYRLDVSGLSLAQAVLEVNTPGSVLLLTGWICLWPLQAYALQEWSIFPIVKH